MGYARNNPNSIICIIANDIDEARRTLKEDYNFYSRLLRLIYPKKRLRKKVLIELKRIEKTSIHIIPRTGSTLNK